MPKVTKRTTQTSVYQLELSQAELELLSWSIAYAINRSWATADELELLENLHKVLQEDDA